MNNTTVFDETIPAGDMASIENIHSQELSISLICSDGCRVDIELVPGQVLEFSAGDGNARVVLHHGDPSKLLIIKPDSAS
ncbi:hypothetical protein GCM10011348_34880 [Marinobacterium nitratireducens]|uniref:Uncharacterized protein n=1 Tax=Marinobacterium nitratireducens TaxID=518897 RepID=A0A918DWZ7_9GAMM|nr:hypothetical protein [Marinobacterium nitratireducens]GGO85708.1 hypothetical protein GCM10011348_34880 [Marinobacterium nitratireducens]